MLREEVKRRQSESTSNVVVGVGDVAEMEDEAFGVSA